jgi:hypothetical protein
MYANMQKTILKELEGLAGLKVHIHEERNWVEGAKVKRTLGFPLYYSTAFIFCKQDDFICFW